MGGYYVESCDIHSLHRFAEGEYPWVNWTGCAEESSEHYAIWGWNEDGTYTVGLALLKIVDYEGLEECNWYIKFMNELAGPIIQPPKTFLKTRPAVTFEIAKKIKEVKAHRKEIEYLLV